MTRIAGLALALFALAAAAQEDPRNDPSRYEKLLVPLYTSYAGGAYGSAWRTRLLMRNESGGALDVFPLGRDCVSTSSCFATIRGYPAFPREMTGFHRFGLAPIRVGDSDAANPALFLYVERDGADDFATQLHVSDTARRPVAQGTQLPVVREGDFFDRAVDIIGVPLDPGTRASLRVYDFESRAGAQVLVRFYDVADRDANGSWVEPPKLLAEDVLTFAHDPSNDHCGFSATPCPEGYGFQPGYIQIGDLLATYPGIASELPPLREADYGIRIELTPITPGLRFWPMVSVTENATSFVTLYTAR